MRHTVAESQTNVTLVFIDSRVKDYQILSQGVTSNSEIIVLKPTEDAVGQITSALQVRNNIAAIHIVSHGSPGCLYLGDTQFSLETLERYARDLQTWSTTLASSDRCNAPSIVLYGCNVAAEDQGVQFVERLSQITGVAVAASTTLTGNAALGGNWNFEMTTGAIASASVFQRSVLAAYPHVLAPAFSNILYGVSSSTPGTDLRSLDLSTGTSTSVGTLAFSSAAIARDSNTGRIYYIENTANNSRVAYFDPLTGTNTVLPQTTGISTSSNFARLSQATSGVIYAMEGSTTNLYTLDQNTGVATSIGSVSGLPTGGGDMAFDPLNPDRLLIYVTGTSQTLFSVNVNPTSSDFLQATSIGRTGLAGPSLAFGQDGQLYLGAQSNLYRLDQTTAAPTLIGSTSVAFNDFASLPVPTASADLQITATDGLNTVAPNSPITYTVTVTNSSTSDLQGIGVSDIVPSAISGVTWSATFVNGTGSFPTTGDQSGSGNTINARVNLNAGASVTYTITGTVSASTTDGTVLSNTATATLPNGINDPNSANNSVTDTTTVDGPPTVTVNSLITNDTRPELTGTVNDPTATVVVNVGGTDYTATNNGDGTWILPNDAIATALADGTYEVLATATDPGANAATDNTTNELTIDTVAPTVGINSLITNDSRPALSGTVNDPTATVIVNVAGTNYTATNNQNGTWTLADDAIATALVDGTYEVVATATDPANNTASDATTNELTIDTVAPTVSVTSLSTNDSTPALSGTVNDPTATVIVNVAGTDYTATNNGNGSWILANDAIATALADGTYEVVATATDLAGNAATDANTNELTVDTAVPIVGIDPLNTNDSSPTLTGTVNEPTATVIVNVNGTDYTATNNGNGTWTLANDAIAPPLADDTYSIVATATDPAGNVGIDTTTNELTVDTAPPIVGITQLNTNDSSPTLTGTVNDPNANVVLTVNGTNYNATNNGDGTWTLADDAIAPPLADGTYDVTVTATDTVGNIGTDTTTNELDIDTTPSAVTVDSLITNDSRPALTGTVNDPATTIVVNVNGTNYNATNNGNGTWTLADDAIATALADGTYDVVATATDPVGNTRTDDSTNELTIDTVLPVVTVDALNTSDSQPPLTGTVNDPTATVVVNVSGTDYTAINNSDGTWTLANDAIDTPLADGTYDVVATATDLAGNEGTDGTNNELIVDTAAPTVTINSLITNDTQPALTGTVNEPTATVIVNVNDTDYTATNNGDGTWTLADDAIATPLADGTYNIVATATDPAGNVAIDTTTSELTIDTVLPTVAVNSLNTNDSRPALTGTVNDPTANVVVNVSGTDYTATNNQDGTWTLADDAIATPLADGTYDVAVTATDPASNAANDTTTNELFIDTGLPTVTINPLDTNDASPPLAGTVDDPTATVQVTVNGSNYNATNNGNGTWTLADNTIAPELPDGTYEVVVTATDAVGNVGTDTSTNELIIDRAPSVVGVNPLTTRDSRPALTGTIDDPTANVVVSINGSNYNATNNADGTWTLADDAIAPDLPDGTYEVVVTATDAAGNVGTDTSTNELIIDLAPPIVGINPLITNNPSPALTGTVSDPEATVVVTVNDSDYTATNNGDGTWTLADNTITPALADGSYDVVVTSTDPLGNVGTDSSTNELTIDTTPPTVSINPLTTDDPSPLLTGTVDDSGATVVVTVNGTDYTAITNEDGTWTLADNTITPDLASGTYDVVVTATDSLGNASTDNTSDELTINATGNATGQSLSVTPNDYFVIQSNAPTATVKFTNVESNAGFVNEMGVFTVDDEQGTINGIAPGEAGYLGAALERGKVILSALANNEFSNLLSPRDLILETGKSLAFYLVQNDTTDNVLASLAAGGTVPNVFFASPSVNADNFDHLQIRDLGNNAFEIAQEDSFGGADSDFNDLLVRFELSDDPPSLGTNLQGSPQRELIDLTDQQGQTVQASLNIDSSAEFDNLVGFYRLANEDGTVIDPLTGQAIAPGSPGYAQAALANSVVQYDQNNTESFVLEGGAVYAPYILANGDTNAAYFPYLGSNADGFDHLRLLGNNVFGFEDKPSGGDRDYNDMVLQVNLSVVDGVTGV